MPMRNGRFWFVLVAGLLLVHRAWGLGEILGQSKEELQLKYDLAVHEHGDGRVTVEFTLEDEGRLKPLDAVELNIPGEEKDKGGGWPTDLGVAVEMKKGADGKRVGRIAIRREWALRAEIWLTTTTFDAKQLAETRYHHVIPVVRYMKNVPAAADVRWDRMFHVMYGGGPNFIRADRLEQLKKLIAAGADVNEAIGFDRMLREGETRADLRGTTWPLDVAVQHGHLELVKLLLASGAKLHGKELAAAAFVANPQETLELIKVLVEAKADVNARFSGFTPLFWTSYKGNKSAVKLLLSQPGIKLDETSPDGHTALMAAAEGGHVEIVEMLLKAGAKVGIVDKQNENAISLAEKALAKQQLIVEKQQEMLLKLQQPPK